MKLLTFFGILWLLAAANPAPDPLPPFRQFRPSDLVNSALKPSKPPLQGRLLRLGLLTVLATGLLVWAWRSARGTPWPLVLTVLSVGLLLVEVGRLGVAYYKLPTVRDRADTRYRQLTDTLNLPDLVRYGIGDDQFRFTVAANRQLLLLVDHQQNWGFVIPAERVASIREVPLTVSMTAWLRSDSTFRVMSDETTENADPSTARLLTIALTGGPPDTIQIGYSRKLFALTVDEFLASSLRQKL